MADDASAELAKLRDGLESAALLYGQNPLDPARAPIAAGTLHGLSLRALAGLDAALSHHKRVPLYGLASTEEDPENCPHEPESELHFENPEEPGEWLCSLRPMGAACSCFQSPDGERIPWPCDEVEDIMTALNGKGEADG